jgi:hypothetical protein
MKRYTLCYIIAFLVSIPFLLAEPQKSLTSIPFVKVSADGAPPAIKKKEEKEILYSPYDCVKIALDDARAVALLNDNDLDIQYIRYLALYNTPITKRQNLKKALDFAINSLNTQYREIKRTAILPATGADPIVIRVNLKDYGIDPKAWDDLAEKGSGRVPLSDPYFHTHVKIIENLEPIYETKKTPREVLIQTPYGSRYVTEYVEEKIVVRHAKKRSKIVLSTAPWITYKDNGAAIGELTTLTQTKSPILRGDWFLTYASWAPAYYQLIGIKGKVQLVNGVAKILKGEKEFEKLALINEELAKKSTIAAVADAKIVTLNNRILARIPTVAGYTGGYYWSSLDTDTGIDDEDYLNAIARFDDPKIKAKELIATAINTLQIYALTDAENNLVLFADPKVAIHGDVMPTRLQDKIVWAGTRNCALCHYEGIIPIRDKVRDLSQAQIALLIAQQDKSKDRSIAKKIKEAFKPDLKGVIQYDNSIHAAAILACNGMKPRENISNFETFIVNYFDGFVNLEIAAREAGLHKEQLLFYLKKAINVDHTVTSLLQTPPVDVSRIPWERQGFAVMMNFLITQLKTK